MGLLSVTVLCKYSAQMKTDAHAVLLPHILLVFMEFLLIIFNKVMFFPY